MSNETIGEIAAKDYRKAEVFKYFGLDFCCGGKQNLEIACEQSGVNYIEVEKALDKVEQIPISMNPSQRFDLWEIDFLSDYIVNTHHRYVKDTIPMIRELCKKINGVHGVRYPELKTIEENFISLADELEEHMRKEEIILFPYIKHLAISKSGNQRVEAPPFASVVNPINMFEDEHEVAGLKTKAIRKLSNDFFIPEGACNTYRLTYGKLEEFERDLFQHIHLENNILFPKALELEKELLLIN